MAEALRDHGVIPDVVSSVPPSIALVTYHRTLQVQIGQELTPTQVKGVPNVQWDADSSCFYTLCLVDPDAPSRTWPKLREMLHWLVVNIPGNDLSKGEVVTNYVSSGPPPFSGLHRYVFLVYRQPGRLSFEPERYLSYNTGRAKFCIRTFAQKYNMGEPVAGNMYQFPSQILIIHNSFSSGGDTDSNILVQAVINKPQVEYRGSSQCQCIRMADPVVRVKEGSLKGKIFEAVDGRNYLAFMGVPYAEPPVGALRFKDPTPLKPWAGVRDATEESKKCAQNDVMVQIIVGDDDCLYANIVTSSLTAKRAVIVWIHGGGFATGSNNFDLYSPDYLVNKDIVFVGVNYRLGPLGFLNMDHEDCPGNQGMKDLVTALHWVKQNIEQFGGDPQNITIMGESAGSAAVHLLCISPTSKGLFHKAILQSGVAVNPWASINENKTCGFELAAALGNESKDAKEVTDFLRTISAKRIAETWEKLHPHHLFLLQLSFLPTVDSKSRNPFLPQPLSQLVSRGIDVPVLIGYNSHEGIISFLQDRPDIVQKCNDDFEATLIDYTKLTNTTVLHKMAKTLRKLYFGDGPITSDKVDNIVQYVGDVVFVNGIQEVAEIQMKKSQPTYMYRLSYVPDHTIKTYFKVKIDGACHADELSLLFHNSLLRGDNILQKGTKDYEVMEQLTQMWTNFAKIGNPIPKVDNLLTTVWPPLSKDRKNYLEIGETLVAGTNPSEETWKVWKEIYLH